MLIKSHTRIFALLAFSICTCLHGEQDLWEKLNQKHRRTQTWSLDFINEAQALYSNGSSFSWTEGGRHHLKDNRSSANAPKKAAVSLSKFAAFGSFKWRSQRFTLHALADQNHSAPIGLTEAFYQRTLPRLAFSDLRLRAGLLIPEVSMEHTRKGWLPKYNVIPSSLNTWVGEELRPLAIELRARKKIWHGLRLSASIAAFMFNDTAGTLMAWRGWTQHDQLLRTGTRWRIQSVPEMVRPLNNLTTPIKEIDDNPGTYLQLGIERPKQWQIHVFYYDALAEPSEIASRLEYAWDTRFQVYSLRKRVTKSLTLVTQFLFGDTVMGQKHNPFVQNDFDSWYVLLNYRIDQHWSLSLRHDEFEVEDRDFSPDANASEGKSSGLTLQGKFKNFTGALEWIRGNTRRVGNENYTNEDLGQNLFLFNLRYRFRLRG